VRRTLAALALLLASVATAQAPAALPSAAVQPQTIRQIKPNLYVVEGAGGNSTVWVSDHGFILVDDKIAGAANFENLVAAIRSVTPLPVRAVFNTHHHFDHVGNNAAFLAAGVPVVGTEALAAELAKAPGTARPDLVFDHDFSIILDTGRADAHHYRPGHTGGDAIVYFPAVKAVALGGLAVTGTPTFDYEGGANIGGWIRTLDDILKLDFDTAIPGRGPPMTKADILAFRDRLATFRTRAQAAVRGGATKATLLAAIRVDDLGWAWHGAWPAARVAGLWTEAGGR
jgi:cyclase